MQSNLQREEKSIRKKEGKREVWGMDYKKNEHTVELGSCVSVTFKSAGRLSFSVPTATEEEEEEEEAETVKGEEL